MADGKQWFRVWTSILTDLDHSSMRLEDVGRWVRLGAIVALHGDHGTMVVRPPATLLCTLMECPFEDLTVVLERLPNVSTKPVQEREIRHGTFAVTLRNWWKYQLDATAAQRQKSRRQSRAEQSRNSPPTPPPGGSPGMSGLTTEPPPSDEAVGDDAAARRFGPPGEGLPRSVAEAMARAARAVVGEVPRGTGNGEVPFGYRL